MTPARRIRDDIETRIHSGDWRPGMRIPFEHELVQTYGCSRATVSKALGALADAGLIERRRKAGSFVAHPPVHSAVMEVPDLAALIAARGEEYRWEAITIRNAAANEEGVPHPALWIEGLHFSGNEPFALERRLISLKEVPEARDADFDTEPPGTWLLAHIPWTSARHVIRAVAPSKSEAKRLVIASHAPCLELERATWRSGRPVTQVRQLFRGDRFDLVAEFKA